MKTQDKEIVSKSKPRKTSERLKEIQAYVGFKNADMASVLGITEQMYELYLSGKFDAVYGIRQERILARAILLDVELDKKIEQLQKARDHYRNYGKRSVKAVTETVTIRHSKERNLNGKG